MLTSAVIAHTLEVVERVVTDFLLMVVVMVLMVLTGDCSRRFGCNDLDSGSESGGGGG